MPSGFIWIMQRGLSLHFDDLVYHLAVNASVTSAM